MTKTRVPFTQLLIETARACPKDGLSACYRVSSLVPEREVWVQHGARGYEVWVHSLDGVDVTATQMAIALCRREAKYEPTMVERLVEGILQADQRASEQQMPCPLCRERPHLDTCIVVECRQLQR